MIQAVHAAADGSRFTLLIYHDEFAVRTHLQHALRSTVENAALTMMRAAAAALRLKKKVKGDKDLPRTHF